MRGGVRKVDNEKKTGRTLVISEKWKKWLKSQSQREQIESATGMTLEDFFEEFEKTLNERKEEIEREGLLAVRIKYR